METRYHYDIFYRYYFTIVRCQDDFGLDPSLLHKKDLDSSQQFLVGFSGGTGVPNRNLGFKESN